MEASGPGCLTRLWAPSFYRDLSVNDVPVVRIYLDGDPTPVIEERWIALLTNAGHADRRFIVPSPFASATARAGDLYLPIPFSRSCKVTFDREPFYYLINWRAYEKGTAVETFSKARFDAERETISVTALALEAAVRPPALTAPLTRRLHPGAYSMKLDVGNNSGGVLEQLVLRLDPNEVAARPEILREVIVVVECDGEPCVWCPIGDFFASPNAINPFETLARAVSASGTFVCRWPMPYQRECTVTLLNLAKAVMKEAEGDDVLDTVVDERAVAFDAIPTYGPFRWDERSMHFHAAWVPDRILPGDRFEDLRFIDVKGRGVLVGDQITVLNPTEGWWGEGDEKIYVDSSFDRGFPDHFGTGTEDYYGWAGGVNPTWADVFSHPWLANVAVGSHAGSRGTGGTTRGFNICTRQRSLDAVPFRERLVFDMEASPGVDQRRATDRLGYSMVTFWYARPGGAGSGTANEEAAKRPIMSLTDVQPGR